MTPKTTASPRTIDPRCLEHDHHFDSRELYDEVTGEPLPNQMDAQCTRCGVTMRDSFKAMTAECEQLLKGKLT